MDTDGLQNIFQFLSLILITKDIKMTEIVVVHYIRIPQRGFLEGMTLPSTVSFPNEQCAKYWIAEAQFNIELSNFRIEKVQVK